jgi:ABC-type glycerol-3-phosphate transport system substrate-binding protein
VKEALAAILAVVGIFVVLGLVGREDRGGADGIEFWCYGTGGADNPGGVFWDRTGELFEQANPGAAAKIVSDIPHGPYNALLTTRFIGGQAPDVFIVDDGFVGELANEGQIEPLDEYIRGDPSYRLADFPPSMVADGRVGGRQYSIPWYGGFGCIFYRADLFAQAGVRPPKTWDELLTVGRTLQDRLGMKHPLAFDPARAFWIMPWIWQSGGRILSDDLTKVAIDTPEFIGGVQFVHDLLHKHGLVDPSLARGTKPQDLWSTGKAAMILDGAWMVTRYDTLFPRWKGKWLTAMVPAGKHRVCFYGGQHLVMNRHSPRKDLAWRFMAFAARAEHQLRWTATGSPPANLKTIRNPEFLRQYPRFAMLPEVMKHGRNNPFAPFFQEIWYNRFQNSVLEQVMGSPDADIAAAVRRAAGDMQTCVDDYWHVHDHAAYRRQGGRP